MFSAFDSDGRIVYAEDYQVGTKCFCKVCGEELRFRKGEVNRPHFAHRSKSDCTYDDRDNKSAWHIRMQEYFPREMREYLFVDGQTGEKHIADVYVPEKQTVIEFQHSHITEEEFLARTYFHLTNGRRIAWVFDETAKNPKEGDLGRLRNDDLYMSPFPHTRLVYRWLNKPRKCLHKGPAIVYGHNYNNYSVCIFSGAEGGDYIHRIIDGQDDYDYVTLSVHTIQMNVDTDTDEFFLGEQYWLEQPEWKPRMDAYYANLNAMRSIQNARQRQATNIAINNMLFPKRRPRKRF